MSKRAASIVLSVATVGVALGAALVIPPVTENLSYQVAVSQFDTSGDELREAHASASSAYDAQVQSQSEAAELYQSTLALLQAIDPGTIDPRATYDALAVAAEDLSGASKIAASAPAPLAPTVTPTSTSAIVEQTQANRERAELLDDAAQASTDVSDNIERLTSEIADLRAQVTEDVSLDIASFPQASAAAVQAFTNARAALSDAPETFTALYAAFDAVRASHDEAVKIAQQKADDEARKNAEQEARDDFEDEDGA